MSLSEWSYTVMVAAAVLYLVAFALHSFEWSSARGLGRVAKANARRRSRCEPGTSCARRSRRRWAAVSGGVR